MKKLLLLTAAASLVWSTAAAAATPRDNVKKFPARVKVVPNGDTADNTPLPMTQKVYFYEDGEWLLESIIRLTYNDMRKVASETTETVDGDWSRTIYTYDENGNRTQSLEQSSVDEGETWTDEQRTDFGYDAIVKNFVTEKLIWNHDGPDWMQVYGHRYDITRNADESVTGVALMSYFNQNYDKIESTELEYGDNSEHPTAITHNAFDYETYEVVPDMKFYDIEWKDCDNQILTLDFNQLLIGANRVGKAMVHDIESDEKATMEVTYTGDVDFQSVVTPVESEDGERYIHSLTTTDEYGSYVEEIYDCYKEDGAELAEGEKSVVKYDSHANVVSEEYLMFGSVTMDGEIETFEEPMGGTTYDYEYGEQGEMLVRIDSEIIVDEETGEKLVEPFVKVISEDFTSSSVTMPSVEGAEIVNRTWYDLQGRQVVRPADGGVYILSVEYSNGTVKTSKVMK